MQARAQLVGPPAQIVTFVWVRARGETTIQRAAAQPRPHCRNRRLDEAWSHNSIVAPPS
jgi:hypothetical protein